MRVLLVEKDPAAAAGVEELLGNEATAVDRAVQARHALRLAESGGYDAVLVDRDLPDPDGHEVLKRLRGAGVRAPGIMLGRRGDAEDKLRAFGNGADDYVARPWDGRELVARLRAVVRRPRRTTGDGIRRGRLVIDPETREAKAEGRQLHLTRTEYAFLELLARRRNMTLSRDMILNHLYPEGSAANSKIIDVYVLRLRRKLKEALGDECIRNVRGEGYSLRVPGERIAEAA